MMQVAPYCPKCSSITDSAGNCLAKCYENKYRVITSLTEDDLRRVVREVFIEVLSKTKVRINEL